MSTDGVYTGSANTGWEESDATAAPSSPFGGEGDLTGEEVDLIVSTNSYLVLAQNNEQDTDTELQV